MAGKKKLLKLGAGIGLLGFLCFVLLFWQLHAVLNFILPAQLEKRGYQDSIVLVETANHKQLSIESLELESQGWKVRMSQAKFDYSLPSLIAEQEIQIARIDSLVLSVTPDELPSSDEPLTLQILELIPIQNIQVNKGVLDLTLADMSVQVQWSGSLQLIDQTHLALSLSELELTGQSGVGDPIIHLPRVQDGQLLKVEIQRDGSSGVLSWQVPSVNITGNQWAITEGSSAGEWSFEGTKLGSLDLTDTPEVIQELSKASHGSFTATLSEFVFGSDSAQWIAMDFGINPNPDTPGFHSDLSFNAGIVSTEGQSIEQVAIQLGNRGSLEQMDTKGLLTFLLEGMEGELSFNHTASNLLDGLSLQGEYAVSPLQFDYSDLPGRYIPGFEDMLFTGQTSVEGTYQLADNTADATADLTLTESSISIPANNLELSGIEATLSIESLKQLRSKPGSSTLSIDLIELGDLSFEDTQFLFDLLDKQTFQLTSGSTELFEGTLALSPGTFVLNPMEVETSIAFESLSLKGIVDGMDLFDGTMEGAISGHLPVRFKNGRFETQAGFLELAEGVPARLMYNTEGMFEPEEAEDKGFLASIGDRIMEKLKLAPENVVEDALSDLTISELRIDIFPEDSPGTPARIRLAGEGTTGNTTVPMILDTNINGTTDELLQFLLRIHSLGTPSL